MHVTRALGYRWGSSHSSLAEASCQTSCGRGLFHPVSTPLHVIPPTRRQPRTPATDTVTPSRDCCDCRRSCNSMPHRRNRESRAPVKCPHTRSGVPGAAAPATRCPRTQGPAVRRDLPGAGGRAEGHRVLRGARGAEEGARCALRGPGPRFAAPGPCRDCHGGATKSGSRTAGLLREAAPLSSAAASLLGSLASLDPDGASLRR